MKMGAGDGVELPRSAETSCDSAFFTLNWFWIHTFSSATVEEGDRLP